MARLKNTDNTGQKQPNQAGRKSASLVAIVIICLILVGIGGTGAYIAITSSSKNMNSGLEESPTRRDVVVTPDNVDQILAEMKETNSYDAFTTSMNVEWVFEDGSTPSKNAYVKNSPKNSCTIYFDVILANTSELVYSSPYIPVGSYLEDITLSKDLDAGTYNAICVYHLVDESERELSTASVAVTLKVLG